ncbi:unnamed protein product, partial [Nesidiocoris tenuis]
MSDLDLIGLAIGEGSSDWQTTNNEHPLVQWMISYTSKLKQYGRSRNSRCCSAKTTFALRLKKNWSKIPEWHLKPLTTTSFSTCRPNQGPK